MPKTEMMPISQDDATQNQVAGILLMREFGQAVAKDRSDRIAGADCLTLYNRCTHRSR